jgi:hypothetical protein
MNTVNRRIEVSDVVKRTLMDAFTKRLAHHIIASTPEHARDGTLYPSENIILAVTHKHVKEFGAEWVFAEESCLDLFGNCVLQLVADVANEHAKHMKQALEGSWEGAMREARVALAAITARSM